MIEWQTVGLHVLYISISPLLHFIAFSFYSLVAAGLIKQSICLTELVRIEPSHANLIMCPLLEFALAFGSNYEKSRPQNGCEIFQARIDRKRKSIIHGMKQIRILPRAANHKLTFFILSITIFNLILILDFFNNIGVVLYFLWLCTRKENQWTIETNKPYSEHILKSRLV